MAEERTCEKCKYSDVPCYEEPCKSCDCDFLCRFSPKEKDGVRNRIAELEACVNKITNDWCDDLNAYENRIAELEARCRGYEETLKNKAYGIDNNNTAIIKEQLERISTLETVVQEMVNTYIVPLRAIIKDGFDCEIPQHIKELITGLEAELDESDKGYEEDHKTIESLLAQRDKLAAEVERLRATLDGAADLMIGGVEGPAPHNESAFTPGEYWVRRKSRTSEELRKKHNMPEWYIYRWKWDGEHWRSESAWGPVLTMEQFEEHKYQLGPRIDEPKDEQFHDVV
jgi:hypothetical protein